MPRSGVEKKPPWKSVPQELRRRIDQALGSPVVRGTRVWGSYGPGPSYRLLLADGRRAFIKAIWPESNAFQVSAFHREIRVYRLLESQIRPWAPEFIAEVQFEDWHAILLEDLGPKTAPPWRPIDARTVAQGLAEFHLSTAGVALPGELLTVEEFRILEANFWKNKPSLDDLKGLAGISGQPKEAMAWLEDNFETLQSASNNLTDPTARHTLLHLDVRSDNLRVVNGAARFFDWPFAGIGPPELDAIIFAPSVEAEGGPDAATVLDWYSAVSQLESELLASAAAVCSGFLAGLCWQPEVPGLPRLRQWQRTLVKVLLKVSSDMLGLDRPRWAESI